MTFNNGMRFKPGVYAKLCLHAYDISQPLLDGWEIFLTSEEFIRPDLGPSRTVRVTDNLDLFPNSRTVYHSGYHGVAYRHIETNTIVEVSVGTKPLEFSNMTNVGNIISDLQIYFQQIPHSHKIAEKFNNQVNTEIKRRFPNQNIKVEFTGHSLGSAHSQLLGIKYPNLAVTTFEGPGIRELLSPDQQTRDYKNIINFVMHPNFINETNTRVGYSFRLKPCDEDEEQLTSLSLNGLELEHNIRKNYLSSFLSNATNGLSLLYTNANWVIKCHSSETCSRAFDKEGNALYDPIYLKVQAIKVNVSYQDISINKFKYEEVPFQYYINEGVELNNNSSITINNTITNSNKLAYKSFPLDIKFEPILFKHKTLENDKGSQAIQKDAKLIFELNHFEMDSNSNHNSLILRSLQYPDFNITEQSFNWIPFFKITGGGLISVGIKFSIPLEISLAAVKFVPVIGLSAAIGGFTIKKIIDHQHWKSLPKSKKAEIKLVNIIHELHDIKKKSPKIYLNPDYWDYDWQELTKNCRRDIATALQKLMTTHPYNFEIEMLCRAMQYKLTMHDSAAEEEWYLGKFDKTLKDYHEDYHKLSEQFLLYKKNNDINNQKRTAEKLLVFFPQEIFSYVALSLVQEPSHPQIAVETMNKAMKIAELSQDKKMINIIEEEKFWQYMRLAEQFLIQNQIAEAKKELQVFIDNNFDNTDKLASKRAKKVLDFIHQNEKYRKVFLTANITSFAIYKIARFVQHRNDTIETQLAKIYCHFYILVKDIGIELAKSHVHTKLMQQFQQIYTDAIPPKKIMNTIKESNLPSNSLKKYWTRESIHYALFAALKIGQVADLIQFYKPDLPYLKEIQVVGNTAGAMCEAHYLYETFMDWHTPPNPDAVVKIANINVNGLILANYLFRFANQAIDSYQYRQISKGEQLPESLPIYITKDILSVVGSDVIAFALPLVEKPDLLQDVMKEAETINETLKEIWNSGDIGKIVIIGCGVILVFGTSYIIYQHYQNMDIQLKLINAKTFAVQENYPAALSKIQEVLAIKQDDPNIQHQYDLFLGYHYLSQSNFKEIQNITTSYLQKNTNDVLMHWLQANAYAKQGNYLQSSKKYSEIEAIIKGEINNKPSRTNELNQLLQQVKQHDYLVNLHQAHHLASKGDLENANSIYFSILESTKSNSSDSVKQIRGRIFIELILQDKNKYKIYLKDAEDIFADLINKNKDDVYAYEQLAIINCLNTREVNAVSHYKSAINILHERMQKTEADQKITLKSSDSLQEELKRISQHLAQTENVVSEIETNLRSQIIEKCKNVKSDLTKIINDFQDNTQHIINFIISCKKEFITDYLTFSDKILSQLENSNDKLFIHEQSEIEKFARKSSDFIFEAILFRLEKFSKINNQCKEELHHIKTCVDEIGATFKSNLLDFVDRIGADKIAKFKNYIEQQFNDLTIMIEENNNNLFKKLVDNSSDLTYLTTSLKEAKNKLIEEIIIFVPILTKKNIAGVYVNAMTEFICHIGTQLFDFIIDWYRSETIGRVNSSQLSLPPWQLFTYNYTSFKKWPTKDENTLLRPKVKEPVSLLPYSIRNTKSHLFWEQKSVRPHLNAVTNNNIFKEKTPSIDLHKYELK